MERAVDGLLRSECSLGVVLGGHFAMRAYGNAGAYLG